ncbi:MAG TPA: NAD/NADP octopine/nopaline dehydrogenase family protein [bacterium]|nr:NAD/NADP octopine/nopaline dehydrogenase family protein [bacterium]
MAKYQKPIAVLGAGNAGCCMAADLTLQGYKVNLYQPASFKDSFKKILDTGKIEFSGIKGKGTARLNKATLDIKEALEGVELINLTIPAFAQDSFFKEIIPYLNNEHIVVLWAGNFGTLRLAKFLRELKCKSSPLIAEVNTMPYGTRLQGPGRVFLPIVAPYFLVSALPATNTDKVFRVLKSIYPETRKGSDILSVAMDNPNPVIHPAGVLLNTGRVEYSKGNFGLYREGITPSVGKVIKDIYMEVAGLAKVLGLEVLKYKKKDFETTSSIMGVAFQAPKGKNTQKVIAEKFPGPHSLHDRYVTEDVPCGLVPMSLMAKKFGVKTPLIDAIINIGSCVCGENYWKTGRTLETLGIEKMTKAQLVKFVKTGRK